MAYVLHSVIFLIALNEEMGLLTQFSWKLDNTYFPISSF